MPLCVDGLDIALRLALTVLAGGLIGIDRSECGRAAGLRTTLLACLAASVSMILANLLLATHGKASDSFATLDPMRLPLGILTGMGFIGAGAIVRKGEMVVGVTTAATLWFVTVIGLCFGSGHYVLGLVAATLAFIALWGLKNIELRLHHDRSGSLLLIATAQGPSEGEIRAKLTSGGSWFVSWAVTYARQGEEQIRTYRAEVRWQAGAADFLEPAFLQELAGRPGVRTVHWKTS
jgi:putative Mg2+ transporter-C (MgtC) family protein